MKNTTIVILIVIFGFIGYCMGSSNKKEVVKEIPATCDYSSWKSLKEIDDNVIQLSSDALGLCSEGFFAASEMDVDKINAVTTKMNDIAPKVEEVGTKRQSVLKTLGY
jgi:hypothetical protein